MISLTNRALRCLLGGALLFGSFGCSATSLVTTVNDGPQSQPAPVDLTDETMPDEEETHDPVEIVRPPRYGKDPRIVATGGFSFGIYDHGTRRSPVDDDIEAATVRVRVEGISRAGFGGGATLEFTATDDDLFADQGTVDGEADMVDVFAYAIVRLTADNARMPIRIGPYYHGLRIEDNTSTETTWASAGGRIEFEPEVILHRSGRNEISLFTELAAGVHFTSVDLRRAGPDEDFDAEGYSLRGVGGIRGRWHGFSASLAYMVRYHNVNKTDTEGGIFIGEIDTVYRGIFFEAGLRF